MAVDQKYRRAQRKYRCICIAREKQMGLTHELVFGRTYLNP